MLAEELGADAHGVRSYESRRRTETADVVAASRKMLRDAAEPTRIAAATTTYRHATHADGS